MFHVFSSFSMFVFSFFFYFLFFHLFFSSVFPFFLIIHIIFLCFPFSSRPSRRQVDRGGERSGPFEGDFASMFFISLFFS